MTVVLVTAVGGGGNGEQLVKCLRMSQKKYDVIGSDITEEAAQQSGADHCVVLPKANDPHYVERLIEMCQRFSVDVVLPGSEPELRKIAEHQAEIRRHVKLLAVNELSVIDICSNKFKTIEFFKQNNFPCPDTWIVRSSEMVDEIATFPVIMKPVVGGGSQHVYVVQDRDELNMLTRYLLRYFPEILIQEYVGRVDQEYTVGILLDADGVLIHSIALNRFILSSLSNRIRVPNLTGRTDLGEVLAISSGVSQGRVGAFPEVTNFCEKVARAIGARFAINIQCRVVSGQPYVFEINPRFSGTSSIRAMLGFNEPDILIRKHLLHETIEPGFEFRYATVLRGLREVIADRSNA
jgi:carbamoyl-phosphate synthase large subunit